MLLFPDPRQMVRNLTWSSGMKIDYRSITSPPPFITFIVPTGGGLIEASIDAVLKSARLGVLRRRNIVSLFLKRLPTGEI